MSRVAVRRMRSVVRAFRAVPDRRAWTWCLGAYGIYLVWVILIGGTSGFLVPRPMPGPFSLMAATAVVLLVKPCLLEEILFRVLLIPHPSEGVPWRRTLRWALVALVLFVASHPLNGLLLERAGADVFTNPVFLLLAAGLGAVCTAAYLRCGSIWPPVTIHWITVVAWIAGFGGWERIRGAAV